MAIDPNIYQQVQPQPNPIQQFASLSALRGQQQQQQMGALELQEKTRQMAAESALNNAMSQALDSSGNIDEAKLQKGLIGTPAASKWPDIQQHLSTMREAKQKMATAEADHVGALAAAADAAGDDPNDKAGVLLAGIAGGIRDGSIPKDHGLAIIQQMTGPDGNPDPAAVKRVLATMKAASQKQTELGSARMTAEARAAAAKTGADKLALETPGIQAKTAIEQQVAAGTQGGITPEQKAVLARQTAANAETARHNRADEGLSGSRLELEKEKAKTGEDVGIQSDVRTTATGRPYVDLSKYKGKDYSAAQKQAHALGISGTNSAESDALQNIDTARQNFENISKSVGKLPTSAASRLLVGPLNKAEALTQVDPDLAAWGTYRSAAIQALRAMAGSKGLRINKAEIETSMQNDIPNITDTQATARQKLERVSQMLASQENGILGPTRATPAVKANPFRK